MWSWLQEYMKLKFGLPGSPALVEQQEKQSTTDSESWRTKALKSLEEERMMSERREGLKIADEKIAASKGTANHGSKLSARYDLIVPEFYEAMAQILDRGAREYGDENWKRGDEAFVQARLNHLEAHLQNNKAGRPAKWVRDGDKMVQEDDLAAVAVNAMFRWWYQNGGENSVSTSATNFGDPLKPRAAEKSKREETTEAPNPADFLKPAN